MGGPARRLRILVVEDEAALRDLVSDIVQDLGHEALAEASGEAAVARVRGDLASVDLAVVDLVLPGMSGLETVRALRTLRPGLPAILSSGHGESSGGPMRAALEAARKERIELLSKPYRFHDLDAAIARVTSGLDRS